MSSKRIGPRGEGLGVGDVVALVRRESGTEFAAMVGSLTAAGVPRFVWRYQYKRKKGYLNKAATIDGDRLAFKRRGSEAEVASFGGNVS